MMVELQIDADAFCKSFREQTRKALACRLVEDSLDFDPSDSVPGTPFVITRYEVGDTTLRLAREKASVCMHVGDPAVTTFRQVNRPQIVQIIIAHVAWVSDLNTANTEKVATTTAIHLPVVFEVTIETCTNMRVLCFHFVGLDGVSDNPISQKLQQTIKGDCTWLPVEQVLAEYMPDDIKLVNAHCTLAQSGKCIVIRMEFWDEAWGAATGDPARQVPEWEQFYTGHIDDRLTRGQERDGWSIFLDQFALTHYVRQTIIDSLKKKKGLSITRQPVATWYPWYPHPTVPANRVYVSLELQQKDACYCFTEDTDVAAEVTADVVIAVPAENTLRIDIYMAVTADFWDAACCVATVALFWPLMGTGQYAQGKISDEDFALSMLPLAAVIGAMMKLDEAGSDTDPPSGFVKDEHDELHFIQEKKLALPNASFGRMTLKGARPLKDTTSLKAEGLYLYGALETVVLPYPELKDPVLEPFCWGGGARCSRRVTATTHIPLNPVNPQHWALLQVCQVRVIDDPLNVFHVEVHRDEHSLPDVIVSVDFWDMKAEYWEPPHRYPCRLMVKTTGGVRILTLAPLPSLTKEQFDSLYLGLQLKYVNDCYLPRHRIFEDLEWPIEVLIEQPGLHHWQVRAVGMEPGERVQLVDRRGSVVARFMASRQGTLVVNALGRIGAPTAAGERQVRTSDPVFGLRRAQGGRMTLVSVPPMQTMDRPGVLLGPASTEPICGPDARGGPNDMVRIRKTPYPDEMLAPKDSSRNVIIRQTFLEDQGYIRLSGDCLAVAADSADGHARVVAVTPGLVETFDISDAGSPRRTGAWRANGVRGAIAFGRKLLLWGEAGIWSAGGAVPTLAPFERCHKTAVRSVAALADRLFVLRDRELIVYDPGLCEQARYECGAEQIAAAGNSIVLRDADGVRFFDPQRGSLDDAVVHAICGTSHIETPAIALSNATVYVRGPKGGLLLTDSGECVAEYEGGAWFEGVARTGRRLAFPDGRRVRMLQATRSVQSE